MIDVYVKHFHDEFNLINSILYIYFFHFKNLLNHQNTHTNTKQN